MLFVSDRELVQAHDQRQRFGHSGESSLGSMVGVSLAKQVDVGLIPTHSDSVSPLF